MIIKGKSRAGPGALAAHLGNAEKNERVQLLETRGTVAQDLRGALIEMDAYGAGTRCQKPLYHAALSPEPPHRLTPEQRTQAVDALEAKLGLVGHARVVVLHEKLGREHLHVVWTRIDLKEMKAVSDSHNYRKHEEVARDLERAFGHDRVQGAHVERDGMKRPDRTPSRAELRQEERTGITGKQTKEQVSAIFRTSDSAEAFRAALGEHGYYLANGDRRDFVIVDRAGGVHSLARRIDVMKADELGAFMAPIDRSSLPSVEQARALAAEARQAEQEASKEKAYSRGGDYVSQTKTALKDHARRQKHANRETGRDSLWDRIEAGEARREQSVRDETASKEAEPSSNAGSPLGDVEMSDAMRERVDRMLGGSGADQAPIRDGPDRQQGAPGGGRTRSR